MPIIYAAGGEGEGTLTGMCTKLKSPRFVLFDGRYPAVDRLELQVDDSSWPVDILQGDHDRQVQIKDAKANDAIGMAKRQIAFVADGWKLVIKPNPLLANFYSDCQTQTWSLSSGPARTRPH